MKITDKIENFKKINGYKPSPIILDLFYQLCKEVAMTFEDFFRKDPKGFARVMYRSWLNYTDINTRNYSTPQELQQSFENHVKHQLKTFGNTKFVFWSGSMEGNYCVMPTPNLNHNRILDKTIFNTANANFSGDSTIAAIVTTFEIEGLVIVRPKFKSIKIDYNNLSVTEIITSDRYYHYSGTEPCVDLTQISELVKKFLQQK